MVLSLFTERGVCSVSVFVVAVAFLFYPTHEFKIENNNLVIKWEKVNGRRMICFGFSEWAGLGFGWDQIRQATVSDVWLLEKCIESVYKLRVLFLLSKQCGRHGITCIPICKEESYWNVLPVHVSFSVFSIAFWGTQLNVYLSLNLMGLQRDVYEELLVRAGTLAETGRAAPGRGLGAQRPRHSGAEPVWLQTSVTEELHAHSQQQNGRKAQYLIHLACKTLLSGFKRFRFMCFGK